MIVSILEIFTCTVKLTTVSCGYICKPEYSGVLSSISSNKLHKQLQHPLYSDIFLSLRMLLIPQTGQPNMLISWPSLGTASLWRDASILLIKSTSIQHIDIINKLKEETIIKKWHWLEPNVYKINLKQIMFDLTPAAHLATAEPYTMNPALSCFYEWKIFP